MFQREVFAFPLPLSSSFMHNCSARGSSGPCFCKPAQRLNDESRRADSPALEDSWRAPRRKDRRQEGSEDRDLNRICRDSLAAVS